MALSLHHSAQPRALQAHTRSAAAVQSLRSGIRWQRSTTWHWQDKAGIARTPTVHAERRTRSVPFLRWLGKLWLHRRLRARRLANRAVRGSGSFGSVQAIICRVFGAAQCQEALRIASTESGFYIGAANGQYLGLFQMGSGERAAYATIGYSTAYQQAVAAHNLFLARGWEPWICCE